MVAADLAHLQLIPGDDIAGELSASQLLQALRKLEANGAKLQAICRHERVHSLARTCRAILDMELAKLELLAAACAQETGWSEQMIRRTTGEFLRLIDEPGLTTLLTDELGPGTRENTFTSSTYRATRRRLVPPPSVVHIMASTVPTASMEAIILSVAAGVPCLIRTSREGRLSARLFLRALREHAPELAEHVAVVTWSPDDESIYPVIDQCRPHIVVHGSDETIFAIKSRLKSPVEISSFGHRYSFGLVAPADALTQGQMKRLAESIALDASLFEGGGCMSPQSIYVLPPASQPNLALELAQLIASHGFPAIDAELPRGKVPTDIAAAHMQQCGLAAFTGKSWSSAVGNVLLWGTLSMRTSPGWRHLNVEKLSSTEDLFNVLAPWRDNLSTAGIYVHDAISNELSLTLSRAGIRRICPIGRMQRPVLLRAHDGLPRVRPWFRICDIEG